MKQQELNMIAEVVAKVTVESLKDYVRKIVIQEVNNALKRQVKPIVEKVVPKPKTKQSSTLRAYLQEQIQPDIQEIVRSTKPKVNFPSTGNRLLDEYIKQAPTEADLTTKKISIPDEEPVPITEIYENDIKNVSVDIAENIDYSAFLQKMNENKGSSPVLPVANPRAFYVKDPKSIVEDQKVLGTQIVRESRA